MDRKALADRRDLAHLVIGAAIGSGMTTCLFLVIAAIWRIA